MVLSRAIIMNRKIKTKKEKPIRAASEYHTISFDAQKLCIWQTLYVLVMIQVILYVQFFFLLLAIYREAMMCTVH